MDEEPAEEEAMADLSGTLVGAGASSQAAAMQGWQVGFQELNPDVTVEYDPIGSGGGRERFLEGATSFAGSLAAPACLAVGGCAIFHLAGAMGQAYEDQKLIEVDAEYHGLENQRVAVTARARALCPTPSSCRTGSRCRARSSTRTAARWRSARARAKAPSSS